MKRQFCLLLIGLTLSLTACAGGYYPAYSYRHNYGYGYPDTVSRLTGIMAMHVLIRAMALKHTAMSTLTVAGAGAEMAGVNGMNGTATKMAGEAVDGECITNMADRSVKRKGFKKKPGGQTPATVLAFVPPVES